MRFRIITLFWTTLVVAVTLGFVSWYFTPPALAIGMSRIDVMDLLRESNASEIIQNEFSSMRLPIYYRRASNSPIDLKRENLLDMREGGNYGRYWVHSTAGRFELHFTNDRLDSIVLWRGLICDQVKHLVLKQ